jgi:polysaccharide pyruvyl transferase WcaK-like protein
MAVNSIQSPSEQLYSLFSQNLDSTLLIGYYGAGNLGDELLLEICLNLLKKHGAKDVRFLYSNPKMLSTWHHHFGYTHVNPSKYIDLGKAIFKSNNIIVGGGGHWGLDSNVNTLLLGLVLFFCRYVFGKKIYLAGVGYYNSANLFGKASAWLAGKSATTIYARDPQSYQNFRRLCTPVIQAEDLTSLIPKLNIATYLAEAEDLCKRIESTETSVIIFSTRGKRNGNFRKVMSDIISSKNKTRFVRIMFMPEDFDKEEAEYWNKCCQNNTNLSQVRYDFNAIALYIALRQCSCISKVISPQYHGIAAAIYASKDYANIFYDNKCVQLITQARGTSVSTHHIDHVSERIILDFINGT